MKNTTCSPVRSFLVLSLFAFAGAGATGCDELDGPGFGLTSVDGGLPRLAPAPAVDGGAPSTTGNGSGGSTGSGGRTSAPSGSGGTNGSGGRTTTPGGSGGSTGSGGATTPGGSGGSTGSGGRSTTGSGGTNGSGGGNGTSPPAGSTDIASLTGAWTGLVGGVTEGLAFHPPDQVIGVHYQGTPTNYSKVDVAPGTYRTQGAKLYVSFEVSATCPSTGANPEEEAFDFRVAGDTLYIGNADFEITLTRAPSLPVDPARGGCVSID